MLAWPCRLGKRLSSPDILLLSKMAWVLLRTLGGYLLLGRLIVAMMVASTAGCCEQIFGLSCNSISTSNVKIMFLTDLC